MPLYDFFCPDCGNEVRGKYLPSYRDAEKRHTCPQCSAALTLMASSVVFHGFKPFVHMTKDGKTHRIRTRYQRSEMMRRYGLGESPYNDDVEARADPREFKKAAQEAKRDFPKRYRKLREKVQSASEKDLAPVVKRAQETRQETARV